MIEQFLRLGAMGESFDPGTAIQQATALHGLLICVGEVDYDEAITGQDVLTLAEAYVERKFKELGYED